ncbi:MAG TPA: response regulator transcription factor [Thermoanaerobaculia bacterium]|nr:response regulator transcription factor [Thermoanaerobaculia bacterium]
MPNDMPRSSAPSPFESAQIKKNTSVLLIGREQPDALYNLLLYHSFKVHHVATALEGERLFSTAAYDVVIVDAMLPDADGLAFIRWLSSLAHSPGILVRTEIETEVDRIVALELGADDVFNTLCNPREVIARTRAIMRRRFSEATRHERKPESNFVDSLHKGFFFAGWLLDSEHRRLFSPSGVRVSITNAEYVILSCLLEDPGVVKDRETLIELKTDNNGIEKPRTVDVLIARLRKKLASYDDIVIIETVHGLGYKSLSNVKKV